MQVPYRYAFCLLTITLLASCRGEPVPRDYESSPPAATHPADKKSEAAVPQVNKVDQEPNYGAEGTAQFKTAKNPPPPNSTQPPEKGLPANAVTTPHQSP